jgi:hypothetical protein
VIFLNALVPLASVVLGGAITYLINVRQRRRNYVEDLFNQAIAAVAAAEMSVDYMASVGRPEHASDADVEHLRSWMVIEGIKHWAITCRQANDALARVLPYAPDLAAVLPFSPDSQNRGTHLRVIEMLRAGAE